METLGSWRLLFISPRTLPKNRFGVEETGEGWRGRCEEEQRGVMDERRPEGPGVFAISSSSHHGDGERRHPLTRDAPECVCVRFRAERHGEETGHTHSIAPLTLSHFDGWQMSIQH